MDKLKLDILENIPKDITNEGLNQIFKQLLDELSVYLNLELISSNVELIFNGGNETSKLKTQGILEIGVERCFQNNFLVIKINYKEYKKYLPIILLREALMCFVPDSLKENEGIKIIINQIIEIFLKKFDIIKEWGQIVREQIVDYDFLSSDFDRFEKFLKLQDNESTESAVKFFFNYIRKNVLLIDGETKDFHDNILKNFILKTSKFLYNDELIETLRILIKIFYKVKNYGALLEYQNYFKEYKVNKEISTNLSLRKFSSNVQWINKFSYIAPSYKINWKLINAAVIFCKLRFHPLLEKTKVDLIIEKLPFFLSSRSSESYFAIEVTGWFVIPLKYQKDLLNFLDKLERFGYIILNICILNDTAGNFINLNYFREFYKRGRIINPQHNQYHKKYEINFNVDFKENKELQKISVLDYVILNRATHWSMDGFSFEKRSETLRTIKSDLFYEILSRGRLIRKLRKNIEYFQNNPQIRSEFLRILESNQKFGFFYIKELIGNLSLSLNLIHNVIKINPEINNSYRFQEFVKKRGISQKIDENIKFNKKEIKKVIYRDFLPIYFDNRKQYNMVVRKFHIYARFLDYCYRLKIFDINAIKRIIRDKTVLENIYSIKENKLKKITQNYKLQNITSNDIYDILDTLSNSSLIIPLLINTINTTNFAKYYIEIILRNNENASNTLDKIKKYFPRVVYDSGIDLKTDEKLIYVQIYLPNINSKEKNLFVSFLSTLFSENLVSLKRYFLDGFYESPELRDFYDLDNQEFFYTSDLFNQYFIYVQKIFEQELSAFKEINLTNPKGFSLSENSPKNLIKHVDDRISREQTEFDINKINDLLKFHLNLIDYLLEPDRFKEVKTEAFFRKYIRSIKFKPKFQNFGLGKYFLYIRPIDGTSINFKLLLVNTFQKIQYPAYIDNIQSLFIRYLFPYRNPNKTYINWLTKSKKTISEYCLFFIKKIHSILHFDHNLDPEGWDLDPRNFKTYLQKVIFDPKFNKQVPIMRSSNIGDLDISNNYDPNSTSFQNLLEITGWNNIDLKSVLGTRNYSLIEKIIDLIKNNLIFPYIKLKNLGFQEKIYIILPNVKKELIDKVIKIFNFFNYGFIYEIEGEYFIHGNPEEITFENGLMIKLYLPLTEISDFQRIFDQLFQFLKIDKHLILNDMVDGNNLLKNVYGTLNFLDSYNPLKNLKWNDKDKIWMNHKLFNEKFEPIYPDLIPEEN